MSSGVNLMMSRTHHEVVVTSFAWVAMLEATLAKAALQLAANLNPAAIYFSSDVATDLQTLIHAVGDRQAQFLINFLIKLNLEYKNVPDAISDSSAASLLNVAFPKLAEKLKVQPNRVMVIQALLVIRLYQQELTEATAKMLSAAQ